MNEIQLEKICLNACQVLRQVGLFIQEELGKVQNQDIETKSLNSLVSYVDQTAERQLVAGLKPLIDGATFLTEEETIATQKGTYQWIIDPLDGTTNFLHQLPFFSISVALQQENKTVIGMVYEVNRQECFYAWKNGGAYLNGQTIQVSQNQKMADSLLATGFPYYDYEHTKAYLKVLEHCMKNTRGIRRFGSAALDLAYVACGRFDAFFEYSLNAWDVAGGAFIVQEAGGVVNDFKGGEDYLFGKEIVAGSAAIQKEVLTVLQKEFYPS